MIVHQLLALCVAQLREAHLEIDSRDMPALFHDTADQPAQVFAKAHQQAHRQQADEPQQADTQPADPVTREEKGGAEPRWER